MSYFYPKFHNDWTLDGSIILYKHFEFKINLKTVNAIKIVNLYTYSKTFIKRKKTESRFFSVVCKVNENGLIKFSKLFVKYLKE